MPVYHRGLTTEQQELIEQLAAIAKNANGLTEEVDSEVATGRMTTSLTLSSVRELAILVAWLAERFAAQLDMGGLLLSLYAQATYKRPRGRPRKKLPAEFLDGHLQSKKSGRKPNLSQDQKREWIQIIESAKRKFGVKTDKAAIEHIESDIAKYYGNTQLRIQRRRVAKALPMLSRVRTELGQNLRPRKLRKLGDK